MLLAIWDQDDNGLDNVFATMLSTTAVHLHPCKITLMENSSSETMLGDMIFGKNYSQVMREHTVYSTGRNIEETAARTAADKYERRVKNKYFLEVIENGLYYIPQLNEPNKSAFDYSFYNKFYTFIEESQNLCDCTMVCTDKGQCLSSPYILDFANLVLVIMSLSHQKFVEFLDKYHSIVQKCLFVIMKPFYLDQTEIKKIFLGLKIPGNRIIIIPCTECLEAHIQKGKIVDYIKNNIDCQRGTSEYLLINRIKKTVQTVLGKNWGGISYQAQQISSLLNQRDYSEFRYKKLEYSFGNDKENTKDSNK
ncbi:MAG: hypothetical protein ACI39R_00650 [Lachnospiraceae bacterium]